MRSLKLVTLFLLLGNLLVAQTVIQVEYEGDPVSNKERQKIEQMFTCMEEFYSQFGLPDTLRLKLNVYAQKQEGLSYLESIGVNVFSWSGGVYISQRDEAVILGYNKKGRGLTNVYHGLGYYFTRQICGKHNVSWLKDGLAEYFKHSKVSGKKVKHELTSYGKGRIRTMYMLGEVDLLSFVNSDRSYFMKKQRTDESYAYTLAHALVTFWIEKLPPQLLQEFVATLQDDTDTSTISDRIDRIYSGGFQKFEQDFSTFCK